MDNLIIASADGHATCPREKWTHYLEQDQHRHLERLHIEHNLYSNTMDKLRRTRLPDSLLASYDEDGVREDGWRGVWDREVRLQQMDREGIAAEFCFPGDHHAVATFWHSSSGTYSVSAVDAGARAFNRWSLDEFGPAKERLLRVGAPLSGVDFDAILAEAKWLGDNGFTGVFTPNYNAQPAQIPIYESNWDPLWSAYVDGGLTLINHAGWGLPQGYMFGEIESVAAEVKAEGGTDEDFMNKLKVTLFHNSGVFNDLRSRQSMWQLMLGGVFDRHPKLKMMVTEVRADWIPATLKLIDDAWEKNRDKLPAKRRPSEYWGENMIAGLSFMNKAEIAMRNEIGVDAMAFGRDYPHTEATWPNTIAYFSDIFRGVPEAEVKAILGENMVSFLRLDRAKLAEVAKRINAPTYQQIANGPALPADLKAHLDERCGYSNKAEGERRVLEVEKMLKPDLPRIAAAGTVFA